MRAPLAFLLGKLDFQKEFRNLQAKPGGHRHADYRRAEDRQPALLRRGIRGGARTSTSRESRSPASTARSWSSASTRRRSNPPLDGKLFQFQPPKGAQMVEAGAVAMAEFVLKYADGRGEIHQQVAQAASEQELREKYAQQGFLIYSIKARAGGVGGSRLPGRPQEAEPREVPDLQPAVRHADPRRPADPQSASTCWPTG